jgi:hypothetical protein
MKEPIPTVSEAMDSNDEEASWEISQMEDLASQAIDSKNITIIHLEEDGVAPLHRSEEEKPSNQRLMR